MDSLIVRGGKPLKGDINISGAKNAALPIMAASLLTDKLHLTNIPKLTDIYTMKKLLQSHGSIIEEKDQLDQLEFIIHNHNINNFTAEYDTVRKMRASIWVLAPLLAKFGQAKVSLPGGCAIGARQVDLHIALLKEMGAEIEIKNGYINAKRKGLLKGIEFVFNKISVGATITGVIAATLASGETILSNCAKEPEIIDLCNCLKAIGAEIDGIGSTKLKIIGKSSLKSTTHKIISDRIEAGTYMIAAAITKGDLNILNINPCFVEHLTSKLIASGLQVNKLTNGVQVRYDGVLKATNIETNVYPGFATDLQAQFMALMTIAHGSSLITENIFENRFMHVPELCRMGANIIVQGNSAMIQGVEKLRGAEVMASDLRASVSLILAALSINEETKINRIYHLDRGYQMLEKKLNNCGAEIIRV